MEERAPMTEIPSGWPTMSGMFRSHSRGPGDGSISTERGLEPATSPVLLFIPLQLQVDISGVQLESFQNLWRTTEMFYKFIACNRIE